MTTTERTAGRLARYLWSAAVLACATVLGVVIPLNLVQDPGRFALPALWQGVVTVFLTADIALHPWSVGSDALPRGSARRRWWLGFDIVAALPLAPLLGLPALDLLRLLKLTRLGPILRRLRDNVAVHPTVPRFIVFLFVLGLMAHWLACGWILLGGPGRAGGDAGYVDALYWCVTTLTTVGYGDVAPESVGQTVYAMAVMLLGVGLYGFVIGNLATLLTRIDMVRAEHMANLDRLAGFLRYRRVPARLQQQIYDYYRYLWENRMGYDENVLLQGLPSALRRQLSVALKEDLVRKLSFLEGASRELVFDLCSHLHPVVFTPGEEIVRAGEYGHHVYFVSQGTVQVEDPDGEAIRTLEEGDFFGELSLLTDEPRSATVRAVGYCDLYSLDRDSFKRTLARYPDFAAHISEVARARGWHPA